LSVPRRYTERELQAAMRQLLEVVEPGMEHAAGHAPPPAPAEEPQVQITAPGVDAQPLAGHVLLVEDNPVNRQVAQRLLSLNGITFGMAENGKEALDALDQGGFDAVLMDCQMPVMDGYTATRIRRQKEAGAGLARIPIIAMTANAMAGDREKCLNAGMDDYMSKPLNRARLEQTLRKWLHEAPRATPASARPGAPAAASAPIALPAAAAAATEAVSLPASATGGPLDAGVIGDLIDVMGDEFTELVRVYLEDTPKAVTRLEQAAEQRNRDGIIAPSHSLKSTSANLGAVRLSELAKRLEHGARSGEIGSDPMILVSELKREYALVAAALNELVAKVRA
jgi:CheY-like chemotaxis protein/HPt (histidine-containing phosphotransfer) domain-containing protein